MNVTILNNKFILYYIIFLHIKKNIQFQVISKLSFLLTLTYSFNIIRSINQSAIIWFAVYIKK